MGFVEFRRLERRQRRKRLAVPLSEELRHQIVNLHLVSHRVLHELRDGRVAQLRILLEEVFEIVDEVSG